MGSGTREDVAIAYELPVLHKVVYIAPVPAVFAAPALVVRSACTSGLRHRPALAVIAASALVMEYVGLCQWLCQDTSSCNVYIAPRQS